MSYFLTNGEVAWEIPAHIGRSYRCGRYLVPTGWELLTNLPKNWYPGRRGEYRKERTVELFLKEAVAGGA